MWFSEECAVIYDMNSQCVSVALLQCCSSKIGGGWSKINAILIYIYLYIYKYRGILGMWGMSLENCNTATPQQIIGKTKAGKTYLRKTKKSREIIRKPQPIFITFAVSN